MALRLHQKQALVAEVNEVAQQAHAAVAAEYIGLTAGQLDVLRAKAREGQIYLHVVKNSLAKRAVEGTQFECLTPSLVGPIMLGFALEDPSSVGRVIKDFAKKHPKLVVKSVAMGGVAYGPSDIERLASLPNREEALAMFMGTLKAPIGNFVRLLNEPGWLRYIGDRGVRTLDDAERYIRSGPMASYVEHGFGLYHVAVRGPAPEPVGICGLLKRAELDAPDLGFAIIGEACGRGYATESAGAVMLDATRRHVGRVLAITSPENEASAKVLRKLGFCFEASAPFGSQQNPVHRYVWMPAGSGGEQAGGG